VGKHIYVQAEQGFGGALVGRGYLSSLHNLHKRWRADSACLSNPQITPPSNSINFPCGTPCG
ncbi:MAG: hypothetical protein ACYC5H_17640, partial [Methylovirgula sp.]